MSGAVLRRDLKFQSIRVCGANNGCVTRCSDNGEEECEYACGLGRSYVKVLTVQSLKWLDESSCLCIGIRHEAEM